MPSDGKQESSDRRVVDELPPRVGLLAGEVDFVFRFLAADLDALLFGSDIGGRGMEEDDDGARQAAR